MLPNVVQVTLFWIVQASALLVFAVPFRWAFVALWAASHFARAIGLTLAFHRYFAHRTFKMSRVVRFVWAFIGTAAMQKGPLWWAGHHVNHHKYADRAGDPHSPMVSGVYYAHIGWFLHDTKHDRVEATNPVLRDFGKVPEIAWLERYFFVPPLMVAVTVFLAGGFPWLIWGFCLPTMTLAHATFAINTVNHLWGRAGSRPPTNRATIRSPRSSPRGKAGITTITAISARRAMASTGGRSIRRGTSSAQWRRSALRGT